MKNAKGPFYVTAMIFERSICRDQINGSNDCAKESVLRLQTNLGKPVSATKYEQKLGPKNSSSDPGMRKAKPVQKLEANMRVRKRCCTKIIKLMEEVVSDGDKMNQKMNSSSTSPALVQIVE